MWIKPITVTFIRRASTVISSPTRIFSPGKIYLISAMPTFRTWLSASTASRLFREVPFPLIAPSPSPQP